MAGIQFDPVRSPERKAIVVSFDLGGFSDFCNHADAYVLLPRFVSSVFDLVQESFLDTEGTSVWPTETQPDKVGPPDYMKFMGDGALMIWFLPEELEQHQHCSTAVVHAMKKLKERLAHVVPEWAIQWHVNDLPSRARFGIATGLVHPLRAKASGPQEGQILDYVGYCINLAIRLQNHCPEIGFIIHEPVLPKMEGLVKMIAYGMKGTRSEPVLMFGLELPPMELNYIKSKFALVESTPDPRIKATRPQKFSADKFAAMAQPRFEVRFVGGPMNGVVAFIPTVPAEWLPITDVKDAAGKVVGQEQSCYRLASERPPRIYQFVSKKPYNGTSGEFTPWQPE